MSDPTYPLFPIFAFLGILFSLVPLPWHLQAWNSGTCYFIFWTSFACLNQFVNSVVWARNVRNPSPWWCEISIRIIMGASVGIPASSLCILRRLHCIASGQTLGSSKPEMRKNFLIDGLVCILLPLVYVVFQLPVQYRRFDIFEDLGCYPAISSSTLTYFTSFLWPLALGMVASVYFFLTLVSFNRSRMQFAQIIATSVPTLTISRYLRTMALAMVLMIFASALAILNIVLNATKSDRYAWRTTNSSYRQVEAIPSAIWRQNSSFAISAELTRWFAPICALVFISLFGFAEEARKIYRLAIVSVTGRDAKSSDVELEDSTKSFHTHVAFLDKKIRNVSARSSQSTLTQTVLSNEPLAKGDEPPRYCTSTSTPYPLGAPIDADRAARPSLPEIDNSDTFTISRFSYYDSSSSNTPIGASADFSHLPPQSPPLPPPSPRLPAVQHSLPPPPRRGPKAPNSASSLQSNFAARSARTSPVPPEVQDVPEDVGPHSYTQSSTMLGSLPERERVRILGPSLSRTGTLGGGIRITVHRQASVDEF